MAVRDPDVEPGAHLAAHPEILYDPIYELGRRRSRTTFARSLSGREDRGVDLLRSTRFSLSLPRRGRDRFDRIFRQILRGLIRELPWKYADRPIYPGANISRGALAESRGFGRLEESSGRAPRRFSVESLRPPRNRRSPRGSGALAISGRSSGVRSK